MTTYVDLWFPVLGESLPADHGYATYGALCRVVPEFHGADWWALHTVHGRLAQPGTIRLPRRAQLGLRLPSEKIASVLSLSGRTLEVAGHRVRLGAPRVEALVPAEALSARLVTIKGFTESEPFEEALRRQLESLAIAAQIQIGSRKVCRVKERGIVGFSVRLSDLTPEASLSLQEDGLGGRRRFGCGVFRKSLRPLSPDRRPNAASEGDGP